MGKPAKNGSRNAMGSIGRMSDSARTALHRGWIDAQNQPHRWPAEYERMSEAEQKLYEFGRLACRNVLAAGMAVPIWRGDLDGAKPFLVASHHAARIAGDPWPGLPGQQQEPRDG